MAAPVFRSTSTNTTFSSPKTAWLRSTLLAKASCACPLVRGRQSSCFSSDKTLSFSFRWQTIADPQAPPPKSEPTLEQLYEEIRLTVSQEAQIIQAVFPNPPVVMQVFIQRVFAQVVRVPIIFLFPSTESVAQC